MVYAAKLHTDRLVSLEYAAANSLNAGIESAATVDIIIYTLCGKSSQHCWVPGYKLLLPRLAMICVPIRIACCQEFLVSYAFIGQFSKLKV